jgi:DNA-binding CsgD family transcriptional regulator
MEEKYNHFIPAIAQRDWNIPQSLTKESNRVRLIEMLASINKISDTTSYYIRDSYRQKIIVDSPKSAILCGHPIDSAENLGFAFYNRIFDKKEWAWLAKMFEETYKVFYSYPLSQRKNLISSYDFTVRTASNGELILRHKGVPFLLCDNGNLWLSLCSVTMSAEKRSGNATITNIETGEQYVFGKGRYVLSDQFAVTQEELLILELLCNDLTTEQITSQINTSVTTFRRKKELLFNKLNVKSAHGAIYKAGLMGLIPFQKPF